MEIADFLKEHEKQFKIAKADDDKRILQHKGKELKINIALGIRDCRQNKFKSNRIDFLFNEVIAELFKRVDTIMLSRIKPEAQASYKRLIDDKNAIVDTHGIKSFWLSFKGDPSTMHAARPSSIVINFSVPMWSYNDKIGITPTVELCYEEVKPRDLNDCLLD